MRKTKLKDDTEKVFLRFGDRERQEQFPRGFWDLDWKVREALVRARFPKAEWYGNGQPGIWAAGDFLN